MTIKGNQRTNKCFGLVNKMKPIQILADPLKINGQIQVIHPLKVNNPDLDEEMKEEVNEQIALPFQKCNHREII